MSGFDTSQPIADSEALKDVDEEAAKTAPSADDVEEADAEELGDATPGPR